jgi:hypothetical protein
MAYLVLDVVCIINTVPSLPSGRPPLLPITVVEKDAELDILEIILGLPSLVVIVEVVETKFDVVEVLPAAVIVKVLELDAEATLHIAGVTKFVSSVTDPVSAKILPCTLAVELRLEDT